MRGSNAMALAAGIAILAAFVFRPVAHGVPWATVAIFWMVALAQAVVPGVLLCHGARLCAPRDSWLVLGQGTTIGLSIQGLALLAGRALGAHWLPTLAALGTVAAGLALARRTPPADDVRPELPAASALTLTVALAAVLVQPLASAERPGEPVPFDMLFHAGNAAELRHRWPLEDPRAAGIPLRYHLLAYALPVETADEAGAPVADSLLALAPLLWVALLAVQAANAGRVLFRDARAGALGAAVALFHADPGKLLGLGPGAFNSHFATGVYGSPPTVCGLVLLAGLAIALDGWVEVGGRRRLAALALLGAATSAAKTTVLPVVIGATAVAAGLALRSRRAAEFRRLAAALAVTAAAGAPLTLWQRGGAEGYSTMVRWAPGAAFSTSPFAQSVARTLGPGAVSGLSSLPAFLAWLVGHLGLAGLAAALWLARRRGPQTSLQRWALGVAAVGGVLGLALDVPGGSQLFLLYNSQLVLCLFAGAGLATVLRRPRSAVDAAILVFLALAAFPAAAGLSQVLPAAARADATAAAFEPSPVVRDYAAGLAWLRVHASRDAVVFADNRSLLLSAIGEARLYYENGVYTARAWQRGPSADPWPERTAVQERLLRRPDEEAVAAGRRAAGDALRLVVVADYVPSRVESGFVLASPGPVPDVRFFPESLFERRFANGAMQVYEARRPGAGPTGR
jgi:hypothetical protein